MSSVAHAEDVVTSAAKAAEASADVKRQAKAITENIINGGAEEYVKVYRGTEKTLENNIYWETGHIMSGAGRTAYMETQDIVDAYKIAKKVHEQWLDIWKVEKDYIEAHGAFGIELSREFGVERTMVSVTTDIKIAQSFAGETGQVFQAIVPKSILLQQTLSGAGESGFLIRYGYGGFSLCN